MRRRSAAGAVILIFLMTEAWTPALARFERGVSLGSNTFSTATLEAPSGLSADPACAGGPMVSLSWTASASPFADGYDVHRGSAPGGPYSLVAHVSGRTTTSYEDAGLAPSTTYHYVVQATAINWTSPDSSEASATTPAC